MSVSRWIVIERDDEERNQHWTFALMMTATVLGGLAVIVGLCAIVTVFF
jgi:cytochrome b subunit of formate dehydrogenase